MLSSKAPAEPGRWRTSRTPYLKAIMDCLSPTSPVERVVFMKAAQLGGDLFGAVAGAGGAIHVAAVVVDEDAGASGGKLLRDGKADTAPCAGDDGYLIIEAKGGHGVVPDNNLMFRDTNGGSRRRQRAISIHHNHDTPHRLPRRSQLHCIGEALQQEAVADGRAQAVATMQLEQCLQVGLRRLGFI
jgi:hypothetical protein